MSQVRSTCPVFARQFRRGLVCLSAGSSGKTGLRPSQIVSRSRERACAVSYKPKVSQHKKRTYTDIKVIVDVAQRLKFRRVQGAYGCQPRDLPAAGRPPANRMHDYTNFRYVRDFFLSRSIAFRLRGGWCRPRGFERSLGVRALVFRAVHTIPKRRVARAPASVQCGDTAAAKNADCFPPAAILRGEVI